MGIADRDYHRQSPPQRAGFLASLTPVVKWLLIANIAIFVIDYLILPQALGVKVDQLRNPPLVKWGAFSIESSVYGLRIWEFITFQFLHGSLGHLLFNSLGLFFFGPWVERWWGSARFFTFYLLCGCGGALFYTLLSLVGMVPGGPDTGLIGASAGIYGILIAVAVIAPDLRVMLLFPPIELSMRQLAIGLLGISIAIILVGFGDNEGGEAGHLGGAIAGFLLTRFPHLLGKTGAFFRSNRPPAPRASATAARRRSPPMSSLDAEVDRILDKISRDGFQSLTEAEREVLQQAAKRQSNQS